MIKLGRTFNVNRPHPTPIDGGVDVCRTPPPNLQQFWSNRLVEIEEINKFIKYFSKKHQMEEGKQIVWEERKEVTAEEWAERTVKNLGKILSSIVDKKKLDERHKMFHFWKTKDSITGILNNENFLITCIIIGLSLPIFYGIYFIITYGR